LYARRCRLSSLHLCDLTVLAAPAGLGLGRLANFVNAELWGKALPTSMQSYPPILPAVQPPWWSVKYPEEILQWNPAVEIDMDRLLEIDHLKSSLGGDTSFYQNVVEAVRQGDQAVVGVVEPLLTAYYPSQIIQAITDGPILVATLGLIWLRPRKPGVIGAVFLIAYGVMRIVTERYRQPDEGVALLLGALSRGQVLSIFMVVAGIAALILCQRRNVERISGLLRQSAKS
ncbi:MAG: prolipoprotein diacylglyceryl transferase, partial [Planctomycetes bacterium]|nr:prolipoprotein diacylglyceryl transferase [Planctomycetota bacterium]